MSMLNYRPALRAVLASTATLLLAMVSAAFAHTQTGSLATVPEATDYYQVTCSDDGSGEPASLVSQVMSATPGTAPFVTVVLHKGVVATTSTDTSGGTTVSPLVFVNAGGGVYDVFLSKTAAGAVNYTLTFHCMTGANGSGIHTGTTIVFKQNQ
jgi:hypothetical protein